MASRGALIAATAAKLIAHSLRFPFLVPRVLLRTACPRVPIENEFVAAKCHIIRGLNGAILAQYSRHHAWLCTGQSST